MKKTLLLLLLRIAAYHQPAAAQKIHFTDTTNRWVELISGGGTEYYRTQDIIRLQGDTTFGGHAYKMMRADVTVLQHTGGSPAGNYQGGPYFFREDTVSQRVYGRMAGDSAETVIYNAAWQVGDTAFHWGATKYFVSKRDSVSISGMVYKVFRFKSSLAPASGIDALIVIEGIGCTAGPFFPVYPSTVLEYDAELKCFHQGGATPALSTTLTSNATVSINNFDNATSCALAIGDVRRIEGVTIAANPGSTAMTIKFAQAIALGRLTIYNAYGQVVVQKRLAGETAVPVGKMLSGAGNYLYKIDDLQTGGIATGKLVFLGY